MADDLLGPVPGCRAGQVIDLSDDEKTILMGAPQCLTAVIQAGQTLVYRESNGQWKQYGNTIDGETATDFFGDGVAINGDGNRMSAAAPGGEHLIIYELKNNELQEIARLEALQVTSKFGEGLPFREMVNYW